MSTGSVVFSYHSIRTLIGVIALTIPIVCVLLFIVDQGTELLIPTSISVTYHLGARNLFVGLLFVVAAFLLAYNGHQRRDEKWPWESILAKLAAAFATVVALFPTSFNKLWVAEHKLSPRDHSCTLPTSEEFAADPNLATVCHISGNEVFSALHVGAAILLIGILFVFCLRFLARAKDKLADVEPGDDVTRSRIRRRIVTYQICAMGMVVTVIAGGLWEFLGPPNNPAVFWVEVLCLWFFGWSWLTAGKQLGFYSAGIETERLLTQRLADRGLG